MTKKDYIVLAEAFRRALAHHPDDTAFRAGVEQAAFEVSRVLATANARFNVDRFMAAVNR